MTTLDEEQYTKDDTSRNSVVSVDINGYIVNMSVNPRAHRFPFCVVWTPIPLLTWLCPIVGHMGIAMSNGVIRDFSAPYTVSEDQMAFGWPTKYWQLNPTVEKSGSSGWDRAVTEASNVYTTRMHNLFCDNCHSHVANALNLMNYNNSSNWNMVKLALLMAVKGRSVSFMAFVLTWLPFFIIVSVGGLLIGLF